MLCGVVHLDPLPGSPLYRGNMNEIIKNSIKTAKIYDKYSFDAIIIENFNDFPFDKRSNALTVAAVTEIVSRIKAEVTCDIGINILRNDCIASHAIAYILQCSFIRVNILVYAGITDQGYIESEARSLALQKRLVGSKVKIFADIGVKHSRALAPSEEIELNDAVERGMADAIIISGTKTGEAPDPQYVRKLRDKCSVPIYIGSGISEHNIRRYAEICDGFIVASSLKVGGAISEKQVASFISVYRQVMS